MRIWLLFGILSVALPLFSVEEDSGMAGVLSGEERYWEFDFGNCRMEVSRTVALGYRAWLGEERGSPEAFWRYLFGLELLPAPVEDFFPKWRLGEGFSEVVFVAEKNPGRSRVLFSLEEEVNREWREVAEWELRVLESLPIGLERKALRGGDLEGRRVRLRIRAEPKPAVFGHYMSNLNPGTGAMAFLMEPVPAFLRLFHDRPETIEPVPEAEPEYFRSTGGSFRDLPLIRPGFRFREPVESAGLEISRAVRVGLDGFAVNCVEGETGFLETLFVAAKRRREEKPEEEPFQLTLSLDVNVLRFGERGMLVAIADLISRWLEIGRKEGMEPHLARRGGKPLVMGYQSQWIWIDYLHRLMEHRDFLEGNADERYRWPEGLGAAPEPVLIPERVRERYEEVFSESMRRGEKGGRKKEVENLARRKAREEAVKEWARMPEGWGEIREAYRMLERVVGEEIFWQFEAAELAMVSGEPERTLERISRDFPAVNFFLPKAGFTDRAREIVREAGAEWGEPIYSQYVAYGQNEREGLFLGNAHGGDGSGTFRRGWYRAIGKNPERRGEPVSEEGRSSLIQYTTWNDYGEHTHLGPGLQMRYALGELGRHLIRIWKTGEEGGAGEQVFLFYRKHPERAGSFPFHHGTARLPAVFEVVTILDEPAEVELWGENAARGRFRRSEKRRVEAGFQVESFSGGKEDGLWAEGTVSVEVLKDSGEKMELEGEEWISHRPFREDVTLVGVCSRCAGLAAEERALFGIPDFRYSEYGDMDGDGLPNWFEMFYGGRGWLNPEDQVGMSREEDENRDGKTNFRHFLERSHPGYFPEPVPYRFPVVISRERGGRIPAEEFDRGGAGVAYRVRSYETMLGGGFREKNELPVHSRVGEGEPDAGDWVVGPFREGEWLLYTVSVSPGIYEVVVRVREGGGRIRLEYEDGEMLLEAEVGDRGFWSTQRLGRVVIPAEREGGQRLRVRFEDTRFRLNWIEFRPIRGR